MEKFLNPLEGPCPPPQSGDNNVIVELVPEVQVEPRAITGTDDEEEEDAGGPRRVKLSALHLAATLPRNGLSSLHGHQPGVTGFGV